MYDIIIIGKGPAGASAAIYGLRAAKKVCVVAKDGGALEKAEIIENYYGFGEPVGGKELLKSGVEQMLRLGAQIFEDEITSVNYDGSFHISGAKNNYDGLSLVIATGAPKIKPRIERLDEFEGKGVSYCAVCDGFFFRNKKVAVLGSGEYALSEFKELCNVAGSVAVLTDGKEPDVAFPSGVEVIDKKICSLVGDNSLQGVVFEDGSKYEINGLFIAVGVAGSADFAKKLGVPVANGKIAAESATTPIKGLFAAGDCVPGRMQVSKAVFDGMSAGIAAAEYVNSLLKK